MSSPGPSLGRPELTSGRTSAPACAPAPHEHSPQLPLHGEPQHQRPQPAQIRAASAGIRDRGRQCASEERFLRTRGEQVQLYHGIEEYASRPHTMLAVCPGVSPGYGDVATLHAVAPELGRVLPVPSRFVRQPCGARPHPRQQPGPVPPAIGTSCAQGIHHNRLRAPRVAPSTYRTGRICLEAANFPHARGRSERAHPEVHRPAAAPHTSSATTMLL